MKIIKTTKNHGELLFCFVDKPVARKMITENHYSKKWNQAFGKINVGVYRDNDLLGVASFGLMMNPKSFKSISRDLENSDEIVELNRLWIDDCLGKNAETLLISSSFKLIKQKYPEIKCVQSFADGRLGCGTIYKASNFKYFGYSETLFFEDVLTGEVYHKVLLENTKRPKALIETSKLFLNDRLKPFKVKTYRYIYPLKKKMSFNIKEESYPPYEKGIEYVNDYKMSDSQLKRLSLIYDVLGDHDLSKKCKELMTADVDDSVAINESFLWFKNEYMKSNKAKGMITPDNTLF